MPPNQQPANNPEDEAPPEPSGRAVLHVGHDKINAQGSQGFINQPLGPVEQHFGEQHIRNVGGDYAEGDIDRRQGVFINAPVYGNVIGQQTISAPDSSQQVVAYLTDLIAELEKRKGILAYVELAAQSDTPQEAAPARPSIVDDWGLDGEFSLLESKPPPGLRPSPHTERKKRRLENILEAVREHPRFVLIGEPGAGKTTTIRRGVAARPARHR